MTRTSRLPLRRDFLGRLDAVRELAYPFFRGLNPRSDLSGPPAEFDGHRPYIPGDDTRWIDWNLFARLEELFVKVFQVEEEVEVLLMVDTSLSMTHPPGVKYDVASAAAAALAYLAFLTSHPVTVIRYAERALDSKGPYRHIQAFPDLTRLLLSPAGGLGTDLRKSLEPFLLRRRRPVTVVVLSDGFQSEPLGSIVPSLTGGRGGRVVLLRIEDPADLHPPLRGNLLLQDIEGEERRHLLSDRTLERQLHQRIAAYFQNLEKGLRQAGGESLVLSAAAPFEEGFLRILRSALPAAMEAPVP
jgi:uncharacterized protein (DUF58 family)